MGHPSAQCSVIPIFFDWLYFAFVRQVVEDYCNFRLIIKKSNKTLISLPKSEECSWLSRWLWALSGLGKLESPCLSDFLPVRKVAGAVECWLPKSEESSWLPSCYSSWGNSSVGGARVSSLN